MHVFLRLVSTENYWAAAHKKVAHSFGLEKKNCSQILYVDRILHQERVAAAQVKVASS
jgi:hypothetical protein